MRASTVALVAALLLLALAARGTRIAEKHRVAEEPVVRKIPGGDAHAHGRRLQQTDVADDPQKGGYTGETPLCSEGTVWCDKHRRCVKDDGNSC